MGYYTIVIQTKNKIFIFIFLIFIQFNIISASTEIETRFFNLSNVEINQIIKETVKKNMTISQRINYYLNFFRDTPYDLKCVGDGIDSIYEPEPLVNFKKTNCMALCEHVIALSISDNWDDFFNNLQKIRYKNGIIGIKTRNHYTMADWVPQNNWLLDDVTKTIGSGLTKDVTRTISHKNFFKRKGITDFTDVICDRTMTVSFIPFVNLIKVINKIKTGDIGVVIFSNKTDIFAAHMFIFSENNGSLFIFQSSNDRMTTYDLTFTDWLNKMMKKTDLYCGISIIRVKPELDKNGLIIKPWNIH